MLALHTLKNATTPLARCDTARGQNVAAWQGQFTINHVAWVKAVNDVQQEQWSSVKQPVPFEGLVRGVRR